LIADKLSELEYKNLIFDGDLNIDFARAHPMNSCILEFFSNLGLRLTDELVHPYIYIRRFILQLAAAE